MDYMLKNGRNVIVRPPHVGDAEALVQLFTLADAETPFLARNPGEFQTTVEKERDVIADVLKNADSAWFVAEYEGKVVGQCSVGLIRSRQRFRHRAELAFVLLKEYWNLGIGGRMMLECLRWCREHDVLQAELGVVQGNDRALTMYQSFGFKTIGTLPRALRYPDGSFADEYLMVKFLDGNE